MPEKNEFVIYLLFAAAAISGGLGGCAVASHQLLSGKKMRFSYFLAYAMIGVVFGLLFAAYGWVVADSHPSQIIGPAIVAGAIGAGMLSGMNIGARFLLKHFGIEVQVTMRKAQEERRGENDESK